MKSSPILSTRTICSRPPRCLRRKLAVGGAVRDSASRIAGFAAPSRNEVGACRSLAPDSARPELVGFGQSSYRRRSEHTSQLLGQLFERLRGEGFSMSFTMEDFKREYVKEHFKKLSPQEQREALQSLSPEERRELLESWPPEELQEYLDQLTTGRSTPPRKPRRKK